MTTRRYQHVHQTGSAQAAPLIPVPRPGGDPRVWIIGSSTGGGAETETGGWQSLWGYTDSLPMFNCGFHDIYWSEDFSSADLWGQTFLVVGSESSDGPVNTARMRWNGAKYGEDSKIAMHHYEPTFGKGVDDPSSHYHIAPAEYPPPAIRHDVTGTARWDFDTAYRYGPASSFGVYHSIAVFHSVRGDGGTPLAAIVNDTGATPANYRQITTYTFTAGSTAPWPGHTERIEVWYAALSPTEAAHNNYYVWFDPNDTSSGGKSQVTTMNTWSHQPTTLKGLQVAEIYNSSTRPTTLHVTYPSVSVKVNTPEDPGAFKVAMVMLYGEYSSPGTAFHIAPPAGSPNLDNISGFGGGRIEFTLLSAAETVDMSNAGMIPYLPDETYPYDTFEVTNITPTSPIWKAYGITAVFG